MVLIFLLNYRQTLGIYYIVNVIYLKMISFAILILLVLDVVLYSEAAFPFNDCLLENGNEGTRKIFPKPSHVHTKHFDQKLDHFNGFDGRTWSQTYLIDESNYKKGGPAYLLLSDRNSMNAQFMRQGYWQQHGRKNNAMLFMLKSRFSGGSQPRSNTANENLVFMNSSQIIEDTVAFIKGMNENHKFGDDIKWIVFGFGYSGSSAVWLRTKYPELVHGAMASSAPLLAKLENFEFFDVVGDVLHAHDERCANDMMLATHKLDKMMGTVKGRKQLKLMFRLCSPLRGKKLDTSYFAMNLADLVAEAVQYDQWGNNVQSICDSMLENADSVEPIKRYARMTKMLLEETTKNCLSTDFEEYVKLLKKTDTATSTKTGRVWIYQTCTEFGTYQLTKSHSRNLFSKHLTLDFYVNLCSQVFGSAFNKNSMIEGVQKTNKLFGGLSIDSPRVAIIYGMDDPWKTLTITDANNYKHVKVVSVDGGCHCWDAVTPAANEDEDILKAFLEISKILDSWVKKS